MGKEKIVNIKELAKTERKQKAFLLQEVMQL